MNRGESVNALKRAIYSGLLANLVMAWNTAQMQAASDRLNARKSTAVPPELIGRIAPTRTDGINLRDVFRFPVETYAERLLPSALTKRLLQRRRDQGRKPRQSGRLDSEQKRSLNQALTAPTSLARPKNRASQPRKNGSKNAGTPSSRSKASPRA